MENASKKDGFLSDCWFVLPGIVKVSTFSYVLGLNYFQISNFTITGSGALIKGVISRHPKIYLKGLSICSGL